MKFVVISAIFFTLCQLIQAGPLRLQKRAAFYIANETACVVDNTVYNSGDPIPTDDPCEACRCRPPGFACVLKECASKPGCRAVRRAGQCCPEYICGCEHNGRMYRDGDEIRDSQNPCYTCHCQGSSIACGFVDCFFRVDCTPEYEPGECCPHYNNCATIDSENSTNVDYAFSSESTYSSETTSVKPETSESNIDSDTSEGITEKHVTEETVKTSSEASPPESLDASLLLSVSEGEGEKIKEEAETDKKDASTESVDDADSNETNLEEDSSEEVSPEKEKENVTELIKSDFEIIKDEDKVQEPEITSEQGTTEVDPDSSEITDKNVEIFPAEESATVEVKTKTDPPTEVTVPVTASITSIPESLEDIDDKANELIKRFRSLKNLTSDDATESPKEHVEVKADESNDATTKEIIEKAITTEVPEKLTTLKLEKEIVVGDGKSSDSTTEAVSKHETLYYNSEDKFASESVETVTTVVEVKEQTISEKVEVETSSQAASKESEQVLYKAPNEVVEVNIKQEITEKSNGETTSQSTFELSDATTPSSLQTETGKSEEKVQSFADDSKIVISTDVPKEIEIISSTTVVTEISSPKVESSED